MPDGPSELERWFVRRGVPHLIDDYSAGTDIWTRSIPFLIVVYLGGAFNALDLAHWSAARNTLVAVGGITILVAAWAATNLARRRPPFSRPTVVGPAEIAVFVVGPAIPSLVVGQPGDAIETVLVAVALLAAIYVLTSYGIVAVTLWALRSTAAQLAALANLVVRALPLLLLFTTFLFINAEVWQVAGTLTGPVYVATLAVFFVLGAVFVLSRMPALLRGVSAFDDWDEITALVAGTPAASSALPAGRPPQAPLTWRQSLNVGLVSVFSQALQITLVALVLTGFFVLFGVLAIGEATTASWTVAGDEGVHVLASWDVGGRTLVVTDPLLRVSGFLGAFTGMYFTVVLSTDATYREEFAEDVRPQIRQALAVRLASRHASAAR